MTTATNSRFDFPAMVDRKRGLVERRMFSDPDIYRLELEQIFARAWNFMAHESQLPNPGDFFLNYIGEDRVIVVRDKEGGVQVLLNTCRHRGNAVCRAEEGHATSFMCTYHGWTYDLHGRLVGVPGFKDYYHEDLDRESWGLVSAAKVESYHGFIFATLDPAAVPLEEYLGPVGRIGIDLLAARGDIRIVGGVQKYTVPCNWKFAADNGVGDWYHPPTSHASARMSNWLNQNSRPQVDQFAQPMIALLGEYGHTHMGPLVTPETLKQDPWRETESAKEMLGPVGIRARGFPGVFPNLWVVQLFNQVCLRLPKGPGQTELWFFTLVDAELPERNRNQQIWAANHTFGPAGILEQDDGENWGQSTMGTRGTVSKRYPFNESLNLGRGEVMEEEGGPPFIETKINEHAQLWLHSCWTEWMAADSWADLKANHSPSPSGFV